MRLFLSTEEMEIDIMSSGHHLLLLAVIVCEMKLIRFCDLLGCFCAACVTYCNVNQLISYYGIQMNHL